ncbi:MAG: cell division protein SepF [Erysipelotrichaceae bacterium]|nr:cell division protein SepF [Erysipelotrichaceae bacterium]
MGLVNSVKNFIMPYDEEGDDVEELVYDPHEVKTISEYESPKTKTKVSTDTKMVLFEPRSFDEAEAIGEHLKNRHACVVNLHRLQREYAQRTIDFLTGVVYALDGKMQKIGHNVILCTPYSIGVDGNISLDSDED